MLLTSTSYSADEDLLLLLQALQQYDAAAAAAAAAAAGEHGQQQQLPELLLLVTGRGSGKQQWVTAAKQARLQHTSICCLFVSPEDYYK